MIKKSLFKLSVAAILMATVAACSSSDSTTGGGTTGGGTTGDGTSGGGTTGDGTTDGGGAGETGVLTDILDRMGRPGISTALVADNDDKDDYNLEGNPATWESSFTDVLVERITIIDGLDGVQGNALLGSASTLASLLVDDRLQINTSIPECDIYLALEIGLGGCGGRTLEADVINDTLRHLVSQNDPVDDLADNDSVFQSDWPFIGLAN